VENRQVHGLTDGRSGRRAIVIMVAVAAPNEQREAAQHQYLGIPLPMFHRLCRNVSCGMRMIGDADDEGMNVG